MCGTVVLLKFPNEKDMITMVTKLAAAIESDGTVYTLYSANELRAFVGVFTAEDLTRDIGTDDNDEPLFYRIEGDWYNLADQITADDPTGNDVGLPQYDTYVSDGDSGTAYRVEYGTDGTALGVEVAYVTYV
jgi:hypothetical protein